MTRVTTATVDEALREAASLLRPHSSTPRLDAEVLLAHVLGTTRATLLANFQTILNEDILGRFQRLVDRREQCEPIAYITGHKEFYGLDLLVTPDVLVPRPETESLVEACLDLLPRRELSHLADIGTGSGAIACALAVELEGVRLVVGSDRSGPALEVARANAARVGARRAAWVVADGLAAFRTGASFDAIVCNPPYVAVTERSSLPSEVRDWEPAEALFSGPEGTEAIARLVRDAPAHLAAGGLLAIEIGDRQEPAVRRMVEQVEGLELLGEYRDHAGRPRGILALAAGRRA